MSISSARRPLALLAVLGMVAALLFAVVGTASAAGPANPALFKACPDSAHIPDPGFTDTAGLTAEDNIDCIAYYGVTTGTSPTTYSPKNDVLRWQMALFLTRMATSAGVVLDPTPPDAGFTDIGHLPAARQLAINQLVEADIVKGTSPTTYSPDAPVIRGHMALFLTRFLGEAITGPGGTPLSGAAKLGAPFTDIGHVSHEQFVAINELWDLVITTGTTPTTYSPSNIVKRDQMASFMTRLMNHANSRPIGVNIQANPRVVEGAITTAATADTVYTVTVRSPGFLPMLNVPVDAFVFKADLATDTPFKSDGKCDLTDPNLAPLGPPGAPPECTVTLADGISNFDGNFTVVPLFGFIDRAFTTFYAWTGAFGAEFDVDTTTYSSVVIEGVPAPPAPDHMAKGLAINGTVLDQCPCFITVHSGDTVTWIAQIVDADGDPFPLGGVDVTFHDAWNDGTNSGTDILVVKTDSTGKATYTKTVTLAPASADFGHSVYGSTVAFGATTATPVTWSIGAPQPKSIKVTTPTEYLLASVGANTVTATVLDQYGDPVPGVTIKFDSNLSYSSLQDIARTTVGSGSWTEPYTWTPATMSAKERITVSETGTSPTASDGMVDFVWAIPGLDGEGSLFAPAEFVEADAKTVVNNTMSTYRQFTWGQNGTDHYFMNGVNSNQAAFEETIVKSGATFKVDSYSADGTTGANWYVDWSP